MMRTIDTMSDIMWARGMGWAYNEHGDIYGRAPEYPAARFPIDLYTRLQTGSPESDSPRANRVTVGDKVTVIVKSCKLIFLLNGEPQGTPVDLPRGIRVAMAVGLRASAKVSFT